MSSKEDEAGIIFDRTASYGTLVDLVWAPGGGFGSVQSSPAPSIRSRDLEGLEGFNVDGLGRWSPDAVVDEWQSSKSSLKKNMACRSIRFQVVVWYISPVDVVLGLVTMKFRVTIFWNAPTDEEHKAMGKAGYGIYDPSNKKVWTMHGRQRAYERELTEILPDTRLVYVPPISILNAIDLNIMCDPEVCQVNKRTNLMKWTCMYKASLMQEDLNVSNFPHDEHDLVLKLGILKHRQPGRRWDKNRWRLDLATEEDNQRTTRVPHGLIVDHVKIPGFSYGKEGLDFQFVPLAFGPKEKGVPENELLDQCLQIKLKVRRGSGYYDKNITPLLAVLNFVAISALSLHAENFGNRSEMILAIAFVEIGIRMTVDSKLPNVGYQIKMQRILNNYFFLLLFLTLESSFVYCLTVNHGQPMHWADWIDRASIVLALLHTGWLLMYYYNH